MKEEAARVFDLNCEVGRGWRRALERMIVGLEEGTNVSRVGRSGRAFAVALGGGSKEGGPCRWDVE
jgi:hypothetical protein